MLVYNITTKVDKKILSHWLEWIKEEHIPEMMATNFFTENKFFYLLDQDEEDASTFVMQYFIDSKEKYQNYIDNVSEAIEIKSLKKWGTKYVSFSTLMQAVH